MHTIKVVPEHLGTIKMMWSSMFFDPYGGDWFLFSSVEGERYMVCHGYSNGALHRDVADALPWRKAQFDHIICCYPGRVAAHYPNLSVMGDWEVPTTFHLEGEIFSFWAKEGAA